MKHLILALILTPALALAADNDINPKNSGDIGGDPTRTGTVTNYTDKEGNYAGSETRYSNGQTVFRNKDGEVIGIINKDYD